MGPVTGLSSPRWLEEAREGPWVIEAWESEKFVLVFIPDGSRD